MSNGLPSMTALLGMLALAGYQNKDKIAEMLKGTGTGQPSENSVPQTQTPMGSVFGNLGNVLGGAGAGGMLSGGLGELFDKFKRAGHEDTAQSWVATGPNKEVTAPQLEKVIGPDVLVTLEKQTGLSREDLLSRLSRELPSAVDKYTPSGHLPA